MARIGLRPSWAGMHDFQSRLRARWVASHENASRYPHCRVERSRGNRDSVVANGIGASLELSQPFVEALPADVEVVRLDAPGARGSQRRPWSDRMSWARLLRRALDELGYDRVDMLGLLGSRRNTHRTLGP